MIQTCRWPDKSVYVSKRDVDLAQEAMQRKYPDSTQNMRSYLCNDHWHLGNVIKLVDLPYWHPAAGSTVPELVEWILEYTCSNRRKTA